MSVPDKPNTITHYGGPRSRLLFLIRQLDEDSQACLLPVLKEIDDIAQSEDIDRLMMFAMEWANDSEIQRI